MQAGTRSKVRQVDDYDFEAPMSNGAVTNASMTMSSPTQAPTEAGDVTAEITSSDDRETVSYETGEEVDEATLADNHMSMSSPPRPDVEAQVEADDTESMFESVEGWSESQPTESETDGDPRIEAYFADQNVRESGEEFFGAFAAILAPVVKTILPTLAGAVVKQGATTLSPRLRQLLARLSKLGINPASVAGLVKGRETGNGYESYEAAELDEVAPETLEQQLEALEVVTGPDNRVQVQNTKVVPWKRICHLSIRTTTGKSYLGTGFFVGPRTIVTAGHCVYIHSEGGWPQRIVVTPARSGMTKPYGEFTSTNFRSVRGWVNGKSRDYDYGAIILPRSAAIPATIGAFGFANYSDSFLRNKRLNTAGYPGDKPSGTMWFHGLRAKSLTARTIVYDIDTAGGQSGSAVWVRDIQGTRIVVGIHTNGALSGNSATRITKPVFDNLNSWRAEGGTQL